MITWYSNWTKLNRDELYMLSIVTAGAGREPMSLVHFLLDSFPPDALPTLSRSISSLSLCVALSPKENRIVPKIYDLRTCRTQLLSVSFGCSQPHGQLWCKSWANGFNLIGEYTIKSGYECVSGIPLSNINMDPWVSCCGTGEGLLWVTTICFD